jgi:hypothetical protein
MADLRFLMAEHGFRLLKTGGGSDCWWKGDKDGENGTVIADTDAPCASEFLNEPCSTGRYTSGEWVPNSDEDYPTVAAALAAQMNRDQLGAWYVHHVGYNCADDAPSAPIAELRELVAEMLVLLNPDLCNAVDAE